MGCTSLAEQPKSPDALENTQAYAAIEIDAKTKSATSVIRPPHARRCQPRLWPLLLTRVGHVRG
jgi:hypothetical protein